MGVDRQKRAGFGLVLVFCLAAHIGPAKIAVLDSLGTGQMAEQLKAGVIEHRRIVAHIHVPHRVTHPGMGNTDKGCECGGGHRLFFRVWMSGGACRQASSHGENDRSGEFSRPATNADRMGSVERSPCVSKTLSVVPPACRAIGAGPPMT